MMVKVTLSPYRSVDLKSAMGWEPACLFSISFVKFREFTWMEKSTVFTSKWFWPDTMNWLVRLLKFERNSFLGWVN